ncbi:MAG: hypothetical protein OHK0046_25510 [Anaerolineae bacterium]
MESVLTALIILFLILFAVLFLGEAALSGQQTLLDAWEEIPVEAAALEVVSAELDSTGEAVALFLRNTGAVPVTDFATWDAIVEYYDADDDYFIAWLPNSTTAPLNNAWSVEALYIDEDQNQPEAFDPGIWNPGEYAAVALRLSPAVGVGEALRLMLYGNGAGVSTMMRRNVPPVLAVNQPIMVNQGESRIISNAYLQTTDDDNTPDELMYTVSTVPNDGLLSLGLVFTQAELDAGRLLYTHNTGTADDSFIFTVSDGVETIGAYSFVIEINEPPVVTINTPLPFLSGGTLIITSALLQAVDPDNAPGELVYTIVSPPAQGNLSLASGFTQEDINLGLLNYLHTGSGADQFTFAVSDGNKVVGTFTFTISVL